MADTDKILRDLIARVDAVERDNAALKRENRALRGELARVRSDVAPISPVSAPVAASHSLSRRQVLQRGVQVAAATAAAGVLLAHESDVARADADHTSTIFYNTGSGAIRAYGEQGPAIVAESNGPNDTMWIANSGTAGAIFAVSTESTAVYGSGQIGVWGASDTDGYGAVYGWHAGTSGFGVVGDGVGTGAGVLGRNETGDGVTGQGKVGVHAACTTTGGYGALIEGGKAQLRLVPRSGPAGKPTTGAHSKGELVLDSAATLWICTVGGTPGTWRKVSTTLD